MTPERLDELRILKMNQLLTTAEQSELVSLEQQLGSWDDIAETAMMIQNSLLEHPLEDVPDSLMSKLKADARKFIHNDGKQDDKQGNTKKVSETSQPLSVVRIERPSNETKVAAKPSSWPWAGWAVAACLLLGLGISLWPRQSTNPDIAKKTIADVRNELIASNASRFESKISKRKPAGDIVWDTKTQKGVMTLTGLTPNNPSQKQYQLWIVDKGRKHAEPVDGGVFNVAADGTATVLVRAALEIREPALFAVTEEPPGGVVVSEKGKVGDFVVVMAK